MSVSEPEEQRMFVSTPGSIADRAHIAGFRRASGPVIITLEAAPEAHRGPGTFRRTGSERG
jgi:hypothetical protein